MLTLGTWGDDKGKGGSTNNFQVTSLSNRRAVVLVPKMGTSGVGGGCMEVTPSSVRQRRVGIISFCPPGPFNVLFPEQVSGPWERAVACLFQALPWFHLICDFRNVRLVGGAGVLLHDFLHR